MQNVNSKTKISEVLFLLGFEESKGTKYLIDALIIAENR